jgi:hypothetical protein
MGYKPWPAVHFDVVRVKILKRKKQNIYNMSDIEKFMAMKLLQATHWCCYI